MTTAALHPTAGVPDLPAAPSPRRELLRVYVWEAPVRLTHWLIAFSIVVLAATGVYLGRPFTVVPGAAGAHFVTGTMRYLHLLAAIVFTLSVLARLAWMVGGNRFASWRGLVPTRRRRWRDLWKTLAFYLGLRRDPPPVLGHNPLAGAAYCLVFALYAVQILTGFALYAPSSAVGSPVAWMAFLAPLLGGLQTARFVHHVVTWLLLGFVAHHVFSSLLMTIAEKNATIDSIFSGYKFVDRETVEATKEEGR